ncbi:hypothetical protein G6F68_012848 [Rhizopus microsporus]|nr:hypothetical protein G6F68_012848 [Rhizopus microsporus]
MLVALVVFVLPLLALYQAIVGQWHVSIPMTLIMIVAGFLFVSVSAYLAGLIGSSNNPVSGITNSTILFASAVLVLLLLSVRAHVLSFLASALSITGVILTVGFSLFPFLMPSSTNPQAGLTVWDASSSHLTLWIMLISVVNFLPNVTLYTAWVYRVMRGKVTHDSVGDTPNSY